MRADLQEEWDLPGGVVEVGEAPDRARRELQEELGITVEVHDLITVNWLPAWRGWDDACIFLFDLGVVDSSITEGMTLQATEIKSVRWCDPATARERRRRRDRAARGGRGRVAADLPRGPQSRRVATPLEWVPGHDEGPGAKLPGLHY